MSVVVGSCAASSCRKATIRARVIKLNRRRGNVVLSRRVVLEEEREEKKKHTLEMLQEGLVLTGTVKNITDYGAFIDLGGIDGLLHVTDMAWRRVNHPSEVVTIGQTVKVKIIKINHETHRISLGIKQLLADPWEGIAQRYPVDAKLKGRVTNITDYGAFVELEAGVEGLVHVSEMSWTKKNVHPGKIVSTSQEVDVVVLDVDASKRRISLGLKQAQDNPWDAFVAANPIGSTVEGEVKNATEFGLFIGLDNDIDGMVHLSDLDWNVSGEEAIQRYRKGETVKAKVLDVDVEKERVSLGIKQLGGDPIGEGDTYKKGQQITVTVTAVETGGLEVKFGEDDAPVTSFIRKSDLSRDRNEQRTERFSVGDRVDAMVTGIDKASRRVSVSIKALEMKDEQEAIDQFGSSDSGASLGDILGAALREKAGSKD